MDSDFDPERQFREAWESVTIARDVHYALFTFGESVLPYYLVCGDEHGRPPISVTRGEVRVNRPTVITPGDAAPEFRNFFENAEEEGVVRLLLARTAQFKHLRFENQSGATRTMSDSVEGAVEKIARQLDAEDEDRVAILTAPKHLGNIAVLRYAAERVMQSGPHNIQELRERGFLP